MIQSGPFTVKWHTNFHQRIVLYYCFVFFYDENNEKYSFIYSCIGLSPLFFFSSKIAAAGPGTSGAITSLSNQRLKIEKQHQSTLEVIDGFPQDFFRFENVAYMTGATSVISVYFFSSQICLTQKSVCWLFNYCVIQSAQIKTRYSTFLMDRIMKKIVKIFAFCEHFGTTKTIIF